MGGAWGSGENGCTHTEEPILNWGNAILFVRDLPLPPLTPCPRGLGTEGTVSLSLPTLARAITGSTLHQWRVEHRAPTPLSPPIRWSPKESRHRQSTRRAGIHGPNREEQSIRIEPDRHGRHLTSNPWTHHSSLSSHGIGDAPEVAQGELGNGGEDQQGRGDRGREESIGVQWRKEDEDAHRWTRLEPASNRWQR